MARYRSVKNNTNTNTSRPFVARHQADVTGVLQGWDRLRIQGTLRSLYHDSVMEYYLQQAGLLCKDFKDFATGLTDRIREAAVALALRWQRPMRYLQSGALRKEDIARDIARRDGIKSGLITILSAVEPCRTWFMRGNRETKRLELQLQWGKCIHLYFYWLHEVLGFCHLRLQTWFPFLVQICINGREWLAHSLDREGIAYGREANCFAWVEDLDRAQALMDQQHRANWGKLCGELLDECHPLHTQITRPLGSGYYWTVAESEYATDVMFRDRAALQRIYPALVHHSMMSFGSEQVLRFLGRKTTCIGAEDEVQSDRRRRVEGVRVKHWLNKNSVKCYDKGSVLRSEVTINEPKDFRVWRAKENDPKGPKSWRIMRRSIADVYQRAEFSRKGTERHLEALAAVHVRTSLGEEATAPCSPVRKRGRRYRALQPFGLDAQLLAIVNRGEYTLHGFRNRDVRAHLFGPVAVGRQQRRQAAAVMRRLQLLRAHGLVRRISKTHRYQVTDKGRRIITALQTATQASTEELTRLAA